MRPDYVDRQCETCTATISAPPSRIAHVARMHGERCATASVQERFYFFCTRRWPRLTRRPKSDSVTS